MVILPVTGCVGHRSQGGALCGVAAFVVTRGTNAASRTHQWQRVCHARIAAAGNGRKCRTGLGLGGGSRRAIAAAAAPQAAGRGRQFRIRRRDFREPRGRRNAVCGPRTRVYARSAVGTSLAIGDVGALSKEALL
jgi:hypothetical protein